SSTAHTNSLCASCPLSSSAQNKFGNSSEFSKKYSVMFLNPCLRRKRRGTRLTPQRGNKKKWQRPPWQLQSLSQTTCSPERNGVRRIRGNFSRSRRTSKPIQ